MFALSNFEFMIDETKVNTLTCLVVLISVIDVSSITILASLYFMVSMNPSTVAGEAQSLTWTTVLWAFSVSFEHFFPGVLIPAISHVIATQNGERSGSTVAAWGQHFHWRNMMAASCIYDDSIFR